MEEIERAYCDPSHDNSSTDQPSLATKFLNLYFLKRWRSQKVAQLFLLFVFYRCPYLPSALRPPTVHQLTSWPWHIYHVRFAVCPRPLPSRSPRTLFWRQSGSGTGGMTLGNGWSLERSVELKGPIQVQSVRLNMAGHHDSAWHYRATTFLTFLIVGIPFLPCRKMLACRPLSPPPHWRNCTRQTEMVKFHSVQEISSISSTLKVNKEPRCTSRIRSTKPRERSDGGLVSCQLRRWS